jgi:hypothetical protein
MYIEHDERDEACRVDMYRMSKADKAAQRVNHIMFTIYISVAYNHHHYIENRQGHKVTSYLDRVDEMTYESNHIASYKRIIGLDSHVCIHSMPIHSN